MEKIRILHIIKSLGRGGAEMLLPETLKYHDPARYEFHYIYFLPWKDQMTEPIRRQGGKVVCLRASNNAAILTRVPAIRRYIKEHRIQLVHCHLPWAGIAGRLAARLAGVPVLYTEHNNFSRYHYVTRLFSRLTLPLNDLVIPVSGDADKALRRFLNPAKIRLVLNGVDTEAFRRTPETQAFRESLGFRNDDVVIVAAAVFRKQKRLDLWLQAARDLHSRYPQCRFILVGDGPEKENLLNLASTLRLQEAVHFAGLQENVKPYFGTGDIYLMTSDFEGLPVALLEAMSMGCAPVATEVGGIPEVIQHRVCGLLCRPGSLPDITAALETLVLQADLRNKLKQAARKRIEDSFSLKNMVRQLENIYEQTLEDELYHQAGEREGYTCHY